MSGEKHLRHDSTEVRQPTMTLKDGVCTGIDNETYGQLDRGNVVVKLGVISTLCLIY